MRLEPEVWDALREICVREGKELRELMLTVENAAEGGGRTSAVRVHVLRYYRDAATEAGHLAAGHGVLDADLPRTLARPIALATEPGLPVLPGAQMQAELDAQAAELAEGEGAVASL